VILRITLLLFTLLFLSGCQLKAVELFYYFIANQEQIKQNKEDKLQQEIKDIVDKERAKETAKKEKTRKYQERNARILAERQALETKALAKARGKSCLSLTKLTVKQKKKQKIEDLSQIYVRNDLWNYISRKEKLPFLNHPAVRGQMLWFERNPHYLTRVTKRSKPYLHLIVREVEKMGLPLELALLPIIESGFYPFSYSAGSASGLWQFIPSTGRLYNLEQNWWVDERRNVLKSTKAALKYLEGLYYYFKKDWLLAVAAYNTGPGRVKKAIARNKALGRPTDFFHLKLPAETRGYVPRLLAVSRLIKYPVKYGQRIYPIEYEAVLKSVTLRAQVDLSLVSELTGLSLDEIYTYNPDLNRWATPPVKGYKLLLPKEIVPKFIDDLTDYPNSQRIRWLRHLVKIGDSLNSIAKRYKTDKFYLKVANDLDDNIIKVGDFVVVPVPQKDRNYYSLSVETRKQRSLEKQRKGKKIIYSVKSGDSLWSIARFYNTHVEYVLKWNKISPKDDLQIGQKLVLWYEKPPKLDIFCMMKNQAKVKRKITYSVRKGDSLAKVAEKFKVTREQIREWNTIVKRGILQPRQKLTIFVNVTNLYK
jgi:membrane-bound lytic murein transglycosylase D